MYSNPPSAGMLLVYWLYIQIDLYTLYLQASGFSTRLIEFMSSELLNFSIFFSLRFFFFCEKIYFVKFFSIYLNSSTKFSNTVKKREGWNMLKNFTLNLLHYNGKSLTIVVKCDFVEIVKLT